MSTKRLADGRGILSHREEQYQYGLCYEQGGAGFEKDLAKAIRYFELASDLGHYLAEYHLGELFARGYGLPKPKPRPKDKGKGTGTGTGKGKGKGEGEGEGDGGQEQWPLCSARVALSCPETHDSLGLP